MKTVTIIELMQGNWNRMSDLTKRTFDSDPRNENEIVMRSRLQNMFALSKNKKELRECILLIAQTLKVEVYFTDEILEEVLRA